MSKFSIIIVLAIVGGGALFILQNSSVSLNLVFLGGATLALPLGIWIVLAFGAGAITSWAFALLFNWSNYLNARELRRHLRTHQSKVDSSSRWPSENWQSTERYQERDSFLHQDSPESSNEKGDEVPPSREPRDNKSNSFSSSEADNSNELGVGKTEEVYEANYRVITPPYRPEPTQVNEPDDVKKIDDDWETSRVEDDDWT